MQIYYYIVEYYSGGYSPYCKKATGYTIAESEEKAIENVKEEYSTVADIYVEKRACIELKEAYK